jgi:hypothetical protein
MDKDRLTDPQRTLRARLRVPLAKRSAIVQPRLLVKPGRLKGLPKIFMVKRRTWRVMPQELLQVMLGSFRTRPLPNSCANIPSALFGLRAGSALLWP